MIAVSATTLPAVLLPEVSGLSVSSFSPFFRVTSSMTSFVFMSVVVIFSSSASMLV